MIIIFAVIGVISFVMAFHSMKDFGVPNEIRKLLPTKKVKGRIIFFKDKVEHYSSESSSSSSV